jgi:glycosyltransferase involved in cell wall biosynthesis
MIVKNESVIIADTLAHLRPYIDHAVICDTGSTDRTPEIVQAVCDRLELPVQIEHHEWKGFGANRSLAFASARERLRTHPADWYMVFDADDSLVGDFPDYAFDRVPDHVDALYATYGTEHFRYQRPTFFRTRLEWAYRGVLHEYVYCVSRAETPVAYADLADFVHGNEPGASYYVHINSRGVSDRSRNPDKYLDDARVLVQAIAEETDPGLVSRYLFYAARSYMDAREYLEAIMYFDRYLEDTTRWYEERYDSRMCKARCMLARNADVPGAFSDAAIRDAFLMACAEDPERVEPWYDLARWCRTARQDYREAYAFAYLGSLVLTAHPSPKRLLFVDRTVYTYRHVDELALAAYWTGRKHESLVHWTGILARADLPADDRRRIEDNRKWCG